MSSVREVSLPPRPSIRKLGVSRNWSSAWALTAYSLLLLTTTGHIAARRHLWFDEILTSFIAGLPNLKAIWSNLLLGTDGQPIGFYIPVHLSSILFGSSPLALRLCAVIPFWLMTLALYYAVARRTSPLYGFIAALLPVFTVAFQYSFEARPYALVLLFSVCSFIAWQFAKEYRFRTVSVPALALMLAAAVGVHYYAILIMFPIVVGEVIYTLQFRRVDLAVFTAVASSLAPLLFFYPHIHAIHIYSQYSGARPDFSALFDVLFSLSPKLFPLVITACVAFGLWAALTRKRIYCMEASLNAVPRHEIAAAGCYLLIPIACFLLALYTKAFYFRYSIAAVIGISLFLPYLLWMFRPHLQRVARILCVLLVLNLLYTCASRLRTPDENSWGTFTSYAELFSPGTKELYSSDRALVLGDGPFLLIAKYGSLAVRDKSFYLVSKQRHSNNSPVLFEGLQNIVPGPFHLADVSEFEESHPSFLLYDPEPWLPDQILKDGGRIAVIADLPHGPLYEVTLPRRGR